MGATSIIKLGEGIDVREAFDELVEIANYQYGHDSYNGTISTTSLGICKKLADKWTASVEKKALKQAKEDVENLWKGECNAFDLGVVHYEIVNVKKIVPKIKKKAEFKIKYVVMKLDDNGCLEKAVAHFENKKDADALALGKMRENSRDLYVVRKKSVNVNKGDDLVTEFQREVTIRQTKPKTIPEGCAVREIHKYLFYGMAAM